MRPRVYAYCIFSILGVAALLVAASIKMRPFYVTVTRAGTGAVGFLVDSTSVRNVYKVRVLNKRNQTVSMTLRLGKGTPEGYRISSGVQTFTLDAHAETTRSCVVEAPLGAYKGISDVVFEVQSTPGEASIEKSVRFLGPNPETLKPSEN